MHLVGVSGYAAADDEVEEVLHVLVAPQEPPKGRLYTGLCR